MKNRITLTFDATTTVVETTSVMEWSSSDAFGNRRGSGSLAVPILMKPLFLPRLQEFSMIGRFAFISLGVLMALPLSSVAAPVGEHRLTGDQPLPEPSFGIRGRYSIELSLDVESGFHTMELLPVRHTGISGRAARKIQRDFARLALQVCAPGAAVQAGDVDWSVFVTGAGSGFTNIIGSFHCEMGVVVD